MDPILREATSHDAQALCDLLNHSLSYGLNVQTDVLEKQLERMREKGNYIVYVAQISGRVVGFIAAYRALILERPEEYLRVIGLSVDQGYRRRGIGTKLIEALASYGTQQGLAYIALNTLPQAVADHAFYTANGFEKKSVCFSRAL